MKQKLKIIKDKPYLPDEEIQNYMDFDALVAKDKLRISKNRKWFRLFSATVIFGSVGMAIYFYSIPSKPESPITPSTIKSDTVSNLKNESEPSIEVINEQPADDNKKPLIKDKDDVVVKKSDSVKTEIMDSIYAKPAPKYVRVAAHPINGIESLYEYFNRELRYPEAAVKDSIEGIVNVFFVINKEGKPIQISIENSLGEVFDLEAIRLIQQMPEWRAATVNGNPVSSRISIPITFKVMKDKKEN
jgi:protein TonB